VTRGNRKERPEFTPHHRKLTFCRTKKERTGRRGTTGQKKGSKLWVVGYKKINELG